ncbi:precursor of CEP9-like [Gastrolobium bilobum]|uniref:precursor of CEP9-like n=1 Tax=Gastrolobium bilobum TaxID=150636 RepID=UPI002AB2E964|nr:precursor of CEP9-like [Gastrolobium bilobum]
MGKFLATRNVFALFLTLATCNDFLLTHGRQIKPLNQHSSLNTDSVVTKDNSQPPLPPLKTRVNVPIPSSDNKVDSPMMPNYEVASFGDSGEAYTNAFQPTTPGVSPGVGHRNFKGEGNNMKVMVAVESPDVKVSVTEGSKNDFQPTDPGHSPGVGHAQQNKIGNHN